MAEYKMCANVEMAIYILEFIKRNYEKRYDDAGVQKYIEALQMGIDALNNQPTADVEEVKHGKWTFAFWLARCSQCHYFSKIGYTPYCPNCGAKMDGRK